MTLMAHIETRRALIRRGKRPLVGYVSLRNTLAVTEQHDRTTVALDAKTRALVAAGAALFGPIFGAFFALRPERFTRMPFFIQAVVAVTIAAMTFVLVRTLVRRPRFELLATGDVVVHDPSLTIDRGAIRGVSIESEMYHNARRTYVPNAVLVLRTGDGDVRLCASPDTNLIASLARKVATLTGTEQKTTAWQVNE
jgi:hypothetical protein